MSTFNEFSLTLDKYQFDVITFSETWLKGYGYMVITQFSKTESTKEVVE